MTAESTINERPAAENPGDFSPRDPEARGMTCYSPQSKPKREKEKHRPKKMERGNMGIRNIHTLQNERRVGFPV